MFLRPIRAQIARPAPRSNTIRGNGHARTQGNPARPPARGRIDLSRSKACLEVAEGKLSSVTERDLERWAETSEWPASSS